MTERVQKIIDAFKNEKNAGQAISSAVNGFGIPIDKYAIMLNENVHEDFLSLCYTWIAYLNFAHDKKWLVDPRNNKAVNTAYMMLRIMPKLTEKCKMKPKNTPYGEVFQYSESLANTKKYIQDTCDYMRSDHRTLQQTFSSLVFYYLREYGDDDIKNEIRQKIDEGMFYVGFWTMPMI